jgi:hypothetical protein
MLMASMFFLKRHPRLLIAVGVLVSLCNSAPVLHAGLVDSITFGDTTSESTHQFQDAGSEVGQGGLDLPMRRLLPLAPPSWKGGTMSFTLKADPSGPNYVTARFWGSDITDDRLMLFCEGKQIGWYHLGDVEPLDAGNEDGTPQFNNRFFYHTSPLPLALTRGKSLLHLEIRSMGRIWGYGNTWSQYQKDMTQPSRGVYALYMDTEGCFVPPPGEKQGQAPVNPPVRTSPGPELLDRVRERVEKEIQHELSGSAPLDEIQMQFLAKAYHAKWCAAYQNPQVVQRVAQGLDHLYALWQGNPATINNAPGAYNGGWLGFGPAGDAVRLLAAPLQPLLDQPPSEGSAATRRAAWSAMLQATRDQNRTHRRLYTNQTIIVDLNAYRANRGVEAIDPANALPEARMLDYLYQSIGIKPWLGSDTDHGPEKPMGDDYWELTAKGLTKELGFVGYYGEVIDWVTSVYEATQPVTTDGFGPGDDKIRRQLIRIAKARGVFREPMLDADGNRAMRIEAIVGWRDEGHYPGNIAYAERPSWDATALYAVAATLDPTLVGYAQQMFADNQFFYTLDRSLKEGGLRVTAGLLGAPGQYEAVQAQPARSARLPMSTGQPDFTWTDEDDGVVAVKHGDEILYASLYWRARSGINFLARVHDMHPTFDRIAVVREDEEFQPSGLFYTYPDWVNMGFGNGGVKYPDDMHQAMAGEKIPVAKIPADVPFKPGQDNPFAGRADFYLCRYGNYLIEMNADKTKSHPVKIPAGVTAKRALELVSRKTVDLASAAPIAPRSTVIFYLGR